VIPKLLNGLRAMSLILGLTVASVAALSPLPARAETVTAMFSKAQRV